MRIEKITIENFRGIKNLTNFDLQNLSILVGDNGTSKTSILEAINLGLSPYFLSGRIRYLDFYNNTDKAIKIIIKFDNEFNAILPDGYTTQKVKCNGIYLEINKRSKGSPKKSFSDLVTITHYVIPTEEKGENGRYQKRSSGSIFKYTERQLSFPIETEGLPKCFYFAKDRQKQLKKGFNSSMTTIIDDYNRRYAKKMRDELEKAECIEQRSPYEIYDFLESHIMDSFTKQVKDKSLNELNNKLKKLNLPNSKFSFIDKNTPFDNAELILDNKNVVLPIKNTGSGIETIIALLFLETLAQNSNDQLLILIDEPELHLHPALQENLVNYLISISGENQIMLATHSPLFIKQALGGSIRDSSNIKVTIMKNDPYLISSSMKERLLRNISANEINFIAFDLPSGEYHNELYGYIQKNILNEYNTKINKHCHLGDNKNHNNIEEQKLCEYCYTYRNAMKQEYEYISLHKYIRHQIHHPENDEKNELFTNDQLRESIESMREMIKLYSQV